MLPVRAATGKARLFRLSSHLTSSILPSLTPVGPGIQPEEHKQAANRLEMTGKVFLGFEAITSRRQTECNSRRSLGTAKQQAEGTSSRRPALHWETRVAAVDLVRLFQLDTASLVSAEEGLRTFTDCLWINW